MNADLRVPPFIEELTGITTAMVRQAPPAARVMAEVADFVGRVPLVAHNASFDSKFWDSELKRIGRWSQPGRWRVINSASRRISLGSRLERQRSSTML